MSRLNRSLGRDRSDIGDHLAGRPSRMIRPLNRSCRSILEVSPDRPLSLPPLSVSITASPDLVSLFCLIPAIPMPSAANLPSVPVREPCEVFV